VVPLILERMAAEPGFGRRDLSGLRVAKVGGGSLARFRRPRQPVLRDAPLPRSMSGKILKREIRSELKDQRARDSGAGTRCRSVYLIF
jgi:acyl-coenzyme A synthetase/AMP-(fatty) acid ligase